jgi:serine protease Do
MSLGSGVLVGHTERLGLVVTNWHVVQDATATIMVAFPNGFRSAARLLKTDRHWDLAALAIWRPQHVAPVPLAAYMPRRGELLTIAGYGGGQYRASTGRLVDYAAPETNFPFELLEVSTAARQGDSGGPIFNSRGEVAGVLFGTGGGSTMGSYCGRVRAFLMTVLPDFESLDPAESTQLASQHAAPPPLEPAPAQAAPPAFAQQQAVQPALPPAVAAPDPIPPVFETQTAPLCVPDRSAAPLVAAIAAAPQPRPAPVASVSPRPQPPAARQPATARQTPEIPAAVPVASPSRVDAKPATETFPQPQSPVQTPMPEESAESSVLSWADLAGTTRAEQVKTVLAVIGVLALVFAALHLLGGGDESRVRKPAPVKKPIVRPGVRRTRRVA